MTFDKRIIFWLILAAFILLLPGSSGVDAEFHSESFQEDISRLGSSGGNAERLSENYQESISRSEGGSSKYPPEDQKKLSDFKKMLEAIIDFLDKFRSSGKFSEQKVEKGELKSYEKFGEQKIEKGGNIALKDYIPPGERPEMPKNGSPKYPPEIQEKQSDLEKLKQMITYFASKSKSQEKFANREGEKIAPKGYIPPAEQPGGMPDRVAPKPYVPPRDQPGKIPDRIAPENLNPPDERRGDTLDFKKLLEAIIDFLDKMKSYKKFDDQDRKKGDQIEPKPYIPPRERPGGRPDEIEPKPYIPPRERPGGRPDQIAPEGLIIRPGDRPEGMPDRIAPEDLIPPGQQPDEMSEEESFSGSAEFPPRRQPEERPEETICGSDEVYSKCGYMCQPTCKRPHRPKNCPYICSPFSSGGTCVCRKPLVRRESDDKCIPRNECPRRKPCSQMIKTCLK